MDYLKHFQNHPINKYIARTIRKRQRNDWQPVIAITGKTRIGKTSLTLILDFLIDFNFSLHKNMLLIPDSDTIEKEFHNLKQYAVYHIDEAIRGTYKMDFQSPILKSLVKLYNTDAYKNICTFLLIPSFSSLSKDFRNTIVDFHIHIYDRGKAIMFIKDEDKDIEDPWHTKENTLIKDKYLKRYSLISRTPDRILEAEKRTKNYAFAFEFPDLKKIDPKTYNEYVALKIKSREELAKKEDKEDIKKNDTAKIAVYLTYQYIRENPVLGIKSQKAFCDTVCQGIITQQSLSNWAWLTKNNLDYLKNTSKNKIHINEFEATE